MKICFATYEGVPLTGGGPFVKMKDLRAHLEKKGIQVDFFNMWETRDKLKEYDLYHIFGGNFAMYGLCRYLKSNGFKYVVNPIFYTRHSAPVVRAASYIDKLLRKVVRGIWVDYAFTRDICEWAEMVLPNTIDEGRIISDGLSIPQQKIRVIHNGVSDKFLNGDTTLFKNKYGLENFILYVGHMGPERKNVLALIKALATIDCPVVFIGNLSNMGESEDIKKEFSKNKKLLFLTNIENDSDTLSSAYAACDTFVLPSQFETPGRAALEAALAGAKIVITPHGGTKDYFKNMVEYVNPYSVASIREGIVKSLNKKKSNELKEHIRNNFLWEKIAEDTISVYKKVLDE